MNPPSGSPTPPAFAVVVPFYNEEAAAFDAVDELCRELEAIGRSWEVVLVDDGSADRTFTELQRAQERWPRCRLLRHTENRGQGAALWTALCEVHAPVVGMMDGDGQNVPGDFGPMLAALADADVVVGVRTPRDDGWLRRRMSSLANAVRRRLLRDGVSDAGCALKVFRLEVRNSFYPVRMLNPFIPAFATAAGWRVRELPVRHRARRGGISKYGWWVLFWRPAVDLFAIAWLLRRQPKPRR